MSTRHLLYLALLTALSLSLFLFEGLIPLPFLAPGAKLGLANLVTVVALYYFPRKRDALTILLLRTVLASLFGGGPTILAYSLSGGLLSFGIMALLKEIRLFSLPAVSAAGGFFHNAGQLTIASLAVENLGLWLYLPILGPLGLVTGGLIGLAAQSALKRLHPGTLPAHRFPDHHTGKPGNKNAPPPFLPR